MFKKIVIAVFVITLAVMRVYSQVTADKDLDITSSSKQDLKLELKNKIITSDDNKIPDAGFNQNIKFEENKKSPGLAMIFSLLIPGAGHLYAGRMDVGKYFLTAEILSWLGIIGLNQYGNAIVNDSRTFASVHSGLNKSGKDDDYFSNVGSFNNIYEYNNYRLSRGEYDLLYDQSSYFWSWDNSDNKVFFDEQRKKSERVYNNTIIFGSVLVINRVASAISSLILVNSPKNSSTSIKLNPEVTSSRANLFDGVKINLSKGF